MMHPPLVFVDKVAPDYWNTGPWWEFGAEVVPLERISGVWMFFQAVLPRGVMGSERFYVLANPAPDGRISKPIILAVPLVSFQQALIKFYDDCQFTQKCSLIKFTYHVGQDSQLIADLELGVIPWDHVHLK